MRRAWLFTLAASMALAIVAVGGFKVGQRAGVDPEAEGLKSRVVELRAKLAETQKKLEVERIRLGNAREVINRREVEEKMVKEGYRFEDIEARMASIKVRFNDLQREVAEGKYAGLALTPAYQELRQVFDHPEFDRLVRVEHGRGQ